LTFDLHREAMWCASLPFATSRRRDAAWHPTTPIAEIKSAFEAAKPKGRASRARARPLIGTSGRTAYGWSGCRHRGRIL